MKGRGERGGEGRGEGGGKVQSNYVDSIPLYFWTEEVWAKDGSEVHAVHLVMISVLLHLIQKPTAAAQRWRSGKKLVKNLNI